MELKMKEKSGRMMTALYVRKLKSRVLCFRTPKLLVRLRVHKDFKVIKFHLCADNVNVSKNNTSSIFGIGLIADVFKIHMYFEIQIT